MLWMQLMEYFHTAGSSQRDRFDRVFDRKRRLAESGMTEEDAEKVTEASKTA